MKRDEWKKLDGFYVTIKLIFSDTHRHIHQTKDTAY